jgi:hypothetical protein
MGNRGVRDRELSLIAYDAPLNRSELIESEDRMKVDFLTLKIKINQLPSGRRLSLSIKIIEASELWLEKLKSSKKS